MSLSPSTNKTNPLFDILPRLLESHLVHPFNTWLPFRFLTDAVRNGTNFRASAPPDKAIDSRSGLQDRLQPWQSQWRWPIISHILSGRSVRTIILDDKSQSENLYASARGPSLVRFQQLDRRS